MTQNETTEFAYSHRKVLPSYAADRVWRRWVSLSTWQDWDQSLLGTQAGGDTIVLGQRFCVVPKINGQPIPVTVVSAVEGLHFTTASAGPMGLMAFGHALIIDAEAQTVTLEHSICAVPSDTDMFRTRLWDHLKADVTASVEALGNLIAKDSAA